MPNSDRYRTGLSIRREVLGDEYVDSALEGADEFTQALQDLVTEYCWGEVWARDSLDRRTRSLINLAMLTAMNRPHELEAHVRGAVRNGCTVEEIREVLLQAAVYCGIPAAVDAFRIGSTVLNGEEKGGD